MTDFPEMTIATDRVDSEMISSPKRWDISAIRKFCSFWNCKFIFRLSYIRSFTRFLKVNQDQFRTGWFIESIVSASLIVLVIRTRNVF
ncbi:magnesium-translocating P-type ATPase, partial [Leptospira noguchii]|nr:magnesium-translocating P-type ATPase [Leptospira noguchii]